MDSAGMAQKQREFLRYTLKVRCRFALIDEDGCGQLV
jgi:hypothetical protein